MIPNYMAYEWLTWGVSRVAHGDLAPDVRERIDADRQRASSLPVIVGKIPIDWTHDRTVRDHFIGHSYRLRSGWRRFAEFRFNEQQVFFEVIGGFGSGPGFGFKDLRIYLDGVLVGRAWALGCSLGGGGIVGPAVAMLRDDLALRISLSGRTDERWEELELIGLRRSGTEPARE